MIGLRRACWGLFGALVCMGVAGCGGGGEKLATVTGKVVEDGQPVAIQDFYVGTNCLQVEFIPLDASGQRKPEAVSYTEDVQEDGSFKMRGLGEGIPLGKYRVAVAQLKDGQEVEEGGEGAWEAKFGRETSPFVFDIADDQEILIDLAKAGE
jgi:hypothetical protein